MSTIPESIDQIRHLTRHEGEWRRSRQEAEVVIAAGLVAEVEVHHQEVAEVVQEVSRFRIAVFNSIHDENAIYLGSPNVNGATC